MRIIRAVQAPSNNEWDHVWIGGHLATMAPGAESYGERRDAALATQGDRIAWIGPAQEAAQRAAAQGLTPHDATGLWMTPGLVDCHTHLIYGGSRIAEFEQRLCGVSYEEIARAGGGIQATVKATRAASAAQLHEAALRRLRRLLEEGVTTIEIKSGYGLELETERRLLEVARALGRELPVTVRTTFLGLHALPPEAAADRQSFVDQVCDEWLGALHAAGLVDAVDAFCENIAFTVAETAQLLRAARRLKLGAHVHAGQLSDMGAVSLAAEYHAWSADHLEYMGRDAALALARAKTVAVLLPTAFFTLRQETPPPVALLREAGVAMAVATDSNPGTSPCTSLLAACNMACTLFRLTPAEALCGVTRHAAQALGMQDDIGSLEVGKRADLALWRIERPAELCYAIGANPCAGVVYGGEPRRLRD